jgi:hypothetical protein
MNLPESIWDYSRPLTAYEMELINEFLPYADYSTLDALESRLTESLKMTQRTRMKLVKECL